MSPEAEQSLAQQALAACERRNGANYSPPTHDPSTADIKWILDQLGSGKSAHGSHHASEQFLQQDTPVRRMAASETEQPEPSRLSPGRPYISAVSDHMHTRAPTTGLDLTSDPIRTTSSLPGGRGSSSSHHAFDSLSVCTTTAAAPPPAALSPAAKTSSPQHSSPNGKLPQQPPVASNLLDILKGAGDPARAVTISSDLSSPTSVPDRSPSHLQCTSAPLAAPVASGSHPAVTYPPPHVRLKPMPSHSTYCPFDTALATSHSLPPMPSVGPPPSSATAALSPNCFQRDSVRGGMHGGPPSTHSQPWPLEWSEGVVTSEESSKVVTLKEAYVWIKDEYRATGLLRRLLPVDTWALLALAGFTSRDENSTTRASNFTSFQRKCSAMFSMLRRVPELWNLEQPYAVSGFEMDRELSERYLGSEPLGAFVCRVSMSQPGVLVLSCKVQQGVPGSLNGNLHVSINVEEHRQTERLILAHPYASHFVDIYSHRRTDKRLLLSFGYTRVDHLCAMLAESQGLATDVRPSVAAQSGGYDVFANGRRRQ